MTLRPTSSLTFHPSVAEAWSLPDLDSRFRELVCDIQEKGILEPIWITAGGEIVDGRHRWRVAVELGLESVPCQVLPQEVDPAMFAISVLCARRHLSNKGQVAYAAYHLFESRHRELAEAKTRGLRRGAEDGNGNADDSVEFIAFKLGISIDTFQQAARLHRIFREQPTLRGEWEPKIMSEIDPIGLGAAIAGIAGQAASAGRTPQRNSDLHRFSTAWSHLAKPATAWTRWDDAERETAGEAVRKAVTAMPDPLLDILRDALRAARRARGSAE